MHKKQTELAAWAEGFTLVELAIVMIIIGLLLGGLLKGQELIESARITATVTQIKEIDVAMLTFRDKYQALPGDMTNPGARLPGCAAYPLCNVGGNGDGFIQNGAPPASDVFYALPHLAAADLISGYSLTGTVGIPWGTFPALLPAKIGRLNDIIYTFSIAGATDPNLGVGTILGPLNTMNSGIYVFIHSANGVPGMTPSEAFRIDSKLDDGIPGSGTVRAHINGGFPAADCGTAAQYAELTPLVACNLYIHIEN